MNKDVKDIDGIFSTRWGTTLQDPKSYEYRYSCQCGQCQSREKRNMICPVCHTKITYKGDDFNFWGYIPIKNHAIIHPNLYRTLAAYFGETTLEEMIEPSIEFDKDGNPITAYDKRISKKKTTRKYSKRKTTVDATYQGIGMIEFIKSFDEILDHFKKKNKNKKIEYYEEIIENRDKIFVHNIPVFTTLMRVFKTEGKHLTFEETNSLFNMMAKLVWRLNDDSNSIYTNSKYQNDLLWDIQERYNKLYKTIEATLSNKKGTLRLLIGGRCGFTSRLIIVPDPRLHTDEVKLSYYALVELLQQTIINVLAKTYGIPYADAYQVWFRSQLQIDKRVYDIIDNLIKHDNGIPVMINRNPSINLGSLLAMRCVGITTDYTMNMPLTVLTVLAADFDGDCLNILYVTSNEFWEAAFQSLCPRNSMIISPNDGRYNLDFAIMKDIVITANTLMNLSRDNYTPEQLEKINAIKQKYKA